jgi:integrase
LKVEALEPARLEASMVRLMVETAEGSPGERRHILGGLSRFLAWCKKQRLIERNPCDDLDRNERPKPGKARDHVPSLAQLKAVWAAVEDEPQRDLIRFLLLVPLRRDEAAGLLWSEIDFAGARVLIGADRMKAGEAHELPLAPRALAILKNRLDKQQRTTVRQPLVFASGALKPFDGWTRLTTRVRARIGQKDAPKARAFTVHDVRRAFVSHLADRFDVDLLDQCLSHTRKGVLGIYQRASRMGERKAAMTAWASLLLEQEPVDNVVKMAARR